ncbi:MAG TPA: hypothetical protein VEU51_17145 [Candidatus Acidoferrales bacterium]|nr:hypothetical protein [Candidatus Acidoferrales bacterium]
MSISKRFLLVASTAMIATAIPRLGVAAGMGGGGSMMGGAMGGVTTIGAYPNGAMIPGRAGEFGNDSQADQPGMGNVSISGKHVVKLSPARQGLPRIDRNITGTMVPVPEMPDK